MKLKIAVLVCMAAAGVLASVALAHDGHGKGHRDSAGCQKLHVEGTLAAGSLVITPKAHKEHDHGSTTTTGTTTTSTTPSSVTVAVPANSRIEATACATVSGTSTTWNLRQAEISAPRQAPPAGGTTTVTVTVTTTTH